MVRAPRAQRMGTTHHMMPTLRDTVCSGNQWDWTYQDKSRVKRRACPAVRQRPVAHIGIIKERARKEPSSRRRQGSACLTGVRAQARTRARACATWTPTRPTRACACTRTLSPACPCSPPSSSRCCWCARMHPRPHRVYMRLRLHRTSTRPVACACAVIKRCSHEPCAGVLPHCSSISMRECSTLGSLVDDVPLSTARSAAHATSAAAAPSSSSSSPAWALPGGRLHPWCSCRGPSAPTTPPCR